MKIEVVPSIKEETCFKGLLGEARVQKIRGYRLKLWLTARTSFRSDQFYTSFDAAVSAANRFRKIT